MTPGYNFQKIRCAIIHDIGLVLVFCRFIGLLVAVGFGLDVSRLINVIVVGTDRDLGFD